MKVTSLPFLSLLLVVWLTTYICAEKILDVSKGSTTVLRPDLVEAKVTSITWKYGDGLAADWYGRGVPFYRSFKDGCSLGTKTGELIIHDVKLEDGGVYTPEINSKTLTAITLRVYSPVPKPHIALNYSLEKTKCSLTCSFDRTDEMGDIEVFWIVGDTIEKGGGELHISEETKEKTFICRLNNTVSSENSNELQNPFWTDDSPRRIHDIKWIVVTLFAALICLMSFYINLRVVRKRNKTKQSKDCNPMIVMECEQSLLDVYQLVLDFFNRRNPTKPYEESDQTLLKVYLMISSLLRKEDAANPAEDVRKSLLYENIKFPSVKIEACKKTPEVLIAAKINLQPDSNRREPDENPEIASSSKTKPDPDTKTEADSEDLNKDPSGSGSAENDPPETDPAESSSGSPDGSVSTSESS